MAASYGMFGPQWVTGGWLFFAFSIVAAAGMVMSLGVILAVAGELINRVIFHDTLQQADMLAASNEELEEGTLARARSSSAYLAGQEHGGVATLVKPTAAEIRADRRNGLEPSWMPANWPCSRPPGRSSRCRTSSTGPCRSAFF